MGHPPVPDPRSRQAKEFFGVWKHLGAMGPSASADRLAALNLLVFSVSLADGYCCPHRPRDFVGRVVAESLVTPGHLDLWMKDLSPDDSRVRRVILESSTGIWYEVRIHGDIVEMSNEVARREKPLAW